MDVDEQAADVERLAVLADPTRAALYRYVCAQREPVSRDEASAGIGVARHSVTRQLDKLAAAGLLDVQYRRLSGRSGPGAGRPAALYTRSSVELSVAVPVRHYDVAGQLMADAIGRAERTGTPVGTALVTAAAEHGQRIGDRVRTSLKGGTGPGKAALQVLDEHGYVPAVAHGDIVLTNCPFRALAVEHPEVVCAMNLALLSGVAARLPGRQLSARLLPSADRCCVVLSAN